MNGIYFLTLALAAMMATASPAKRDTSSKEKSMGVFPMENYDSYMPKAQQHFIKNLLRERRAAAGFGGYASSYNSYQGNYKKYMPHLEQLFMEKYAPKFASGKKTKSKE